MTAADEWIHIPLPGDHYSPQSGSSYGTVIYELSRRHLGRSRIIVGRGTFDGYPSYASGEGVEVDHRPYPNRQRRLLDMLSGAVGMSRPMKWKGYSAALDGIPDEFDGWIFIHGEPGIVRPIASARPQAKIALYCHYELFRWYTGREVRQVLGAADAAICVSQHVREYIVRKAGRSVQSLHVVPNGIDTDRFRPAQEPLSAGDPIILYVGRVEPEKGVHLLIAACRILKDRGFGFRLRIVGGKYLGADAPVSGYQRDLIKSAEPLKTAVEFSPFVDRTMIPSVYQSAAIFCAPSVWDEPFGLTVAEAMASGLPVVVSRKGALPDVAGDAGVYFDPGDVAALADSLGELLRDEPRRHRLGQKGRERSMQFGWDGVYNQLTSALNASLEESTIRRSPSLELSK